MTIEITVFKGSLDGSIGEEKSKRSELRHDDVLIRITHSGVCCTSVYRRRTDMALGHEETGVVEATVTDARTLKKGDSEGWGYQRDCYGLCRQCLSGWQTMCPERKMYAEANLDQGSFGTQAIRREGFLFKIPENMDNEDVAR